MTGLINFCNDLVCVTVVLGGCLEVIALKSTRRDVLKIQVYG